MIAVVYGKDVADSAWGPWFALSRGGITFALCAYGFVASVLPVWLLLCPRDYLSSFLKTPIEPSDIERHWFGIMAFPGRRGSTASDSKHDLKTLDRIVGVPLQASHGFMYGLSAGRRAADRIIANKLGR